MKPIFRQKKIQASFDRNGFVKLKLLTENQVDELYRFFIANQARHATVSHLHHTTTDTMDSDLMRAVDEKLKSVLFPALQQVMNEIKPLAATYHIKEPGAGSQTGIHQDPTFVDESRFYSVNVWVALQDIGPRNGNLYFVPGSHNAVHSLRPMPVFPRYYEHFSHKLPGKSVSMPLKKGEAVAFSNATIHGATENASETIRLAATLLVCPQEAEWLLYYNDQKSGELTKHALNLDIFHSLGRGVKPVSEPVPVAADIAAFPQLSYEEFLRKTNKIGYSRLNPLNLFRRKIRL